jgi:protein tyrosine phosphatase
MNFEAAKPKKEKLAHDISKLLETWAAKQSVPEYLSIPLRDPFKEQCWHKILNRFGGKMGPYVDHMMTDIQGVDYINATDYPAQYFEGANTRDFVSTMCPILSTFEHFWIMVWEKNAYAVVNLTCFEGRLGSGPQDKREIYWPPYRSGVFEDASVTQHWAVTVENVLVEHAHDIKKMARTTLRLRDNRTESRTFGASRTIFLYTYENWVDFGDLSTILSESFKSVANAVCRLALEVHEAVTDTFPVSNTIVHCSAGVGRTGTFISLSHLLYELNNFLPNSDMLGCIHSHLASIISSMRQKRLWMVKSEFEYALIFASLRTMLTDAPDKLRILWSDEMIEEEKLKEHISDDTLNDHDLKNYELASD